LFAARLRNLLSYYLKSRLVEDYDTLIELLISDRLKGSLPQGLLNYILTQEGESWYVASKVALLADVYVNNRATVIGQKTSEGKPVKIATVTSSGTAGGQNHHGARGGQSQAGSNDGQAGQQSPTQARRWQCFNCDEFGHISRDCPQERADAHNGPPSPSRSGRIKCHNCLGWGHMARDCASEPSGRRGGPRGSWRGRYRDGPRGDRQNGGVRVNLVSTGGMTQVKTREMGVQYGDGGEQANPNNHNSWEFGAHPIVGTVCAYDASFDLHAYPLKYVNVTASGCKCVALEDSGCQIPLVSNRLFSELCQETVGNVTIHGFARNQTVQAPLANVTVCLNDAERGNVRELPIMCAVTDFCSQDYDVILPAAVLCNLQAKAVVCKGPCNEPTMLTCCQEQPSVNVTTADRLSSETKVGADVGSKPKLSRTDRQHKCNLGCGMSHWAYTVVMLRILCVALLICVALIFVIDNRDVMFARVLTSKPVVLSCLSLSQRSSLSRQADLMTQLQSEPRHERRQLIDEIADRFDDRPGRCDAVVRQVQATDGLVRRQMQPCCAPDVASVSRSLQPSNSLLGRLIVLVFATRTYSYGETKKDGGVRLACDYCDLIIYCR